MTLQINGTNVVNADRSITLGTATPGAPVTGMMRYNSTLPEFQVYDGAAWVPFKKTLAGSSARLYSWGSNYSGVGGDNTTIRRSSPVSVVGIYNDWISMTTSGLCSHAIRSNGTAFVWGFNNYRLGDGASQPRSSPAPLAGGFTDWVSMYNGSAASVGVRANGALWAWGYNVYGQVGNNSTAQVSSPVAVAGGSTWKTAKSGERATLGIRTDGTLWAWGRNNYGQLGNGTTTNRSSPVAAVGGFTDWEDVSAGSYHSLGLRANGTLWAWGRNNYGQLGDNNGIVLSRLSPVSVVGGFFDWVGVNGGQTHSIAIRANGTLWAWGSNTYGKLGDGSAISESKSSPVSVVGGFTDWIQISAGGTHNIALRANGTIWSWGQNLYGQLGDNSATTASKSSPVSVLGGFADWIMVSAGSSQSLGLRA